MLLLYPPMAKACEPPAGIPILAGALKAHEQPYKILDMNLEGQIYLLNNYFKKFPKKKHNLDLIRSPGAFKSKDSYTKVINELTRGLNFNIDSKFNLTLSNFSSVHIDPLKSTDLISHSYNYKENPFYQYYSETIPKLILETQTDIIGISLQFLNQAVCAFALIGYIRDNYKHIKIVVGGGLITSWSKSPNWVNPFNSVIDHILIGPGEEKLLGYLNVEPNKELLKKLKPDYDNIHKDKYFSNGFILPITGSLGCGWKKCTFCPEKAEDNPYIAKCPDNVLKEIRYLRDRYNPVLIHLLDNEISPKLLKKLSEEATKVPWYGFTKFYKELKDLSFCKKLKENGCYMLKLGLESGDQEVLNFMKKGISLDDVEIILQNLKLAGIKTFIYLLFGTPEEDYIKAKKTLDFVIKHSEEINYLNIAIFNLPVGSELQKQQDTFLFSDADLTLYTGFRHPKNWNRKEVRIFLNKEFKVHPKTKKILNNTPVIFNANHSFFFDMELK